MKNQTKRLTKAACLGHSEWGLPLLLSGNGVFQIKVSRVERDSCQPEHENASGCQCAAIPESANQMRQNKTEHPSHSTSKYLECQKILVRFQVLHVLLGYIPSPSWHSFLTCPCCLGTAISPLPKRPRSPAGGPPSRKKGDHSCRLIGAEYLAEERRSRTGKFPQWEGFHDGFHGGLIASWMKPMLEPFYFA